MDAAAQSKLDEILRAILELPEGAPLAACQRDHMASWDSLAQVTLIAALEDEFGIGFEIADYVKLETYPNIVATLTAKLAASSGVKVA
jgi:acyl carrier protein